MSSEKSINNFSKIISTCVLIIPLVASTTFFKVFLNDHVTSKVATLLRRRLYVCRALSREENVHQAEFKLCTNPTESHVDNFDIEKR